MRIESAPPVHGPKATGKNCLFGGRSLRGSLGPLTGKLFPFVWDEQNGMRNARDAHIEVFPPVVLGDFTGDNSVGADDIPFFVSTVLDPCPATPRDRKAADVNADRFVNGLDVAAFVGELLGP